MSNESAAAFINKLEGAPPAFEGYGGVTRQTARRSTGGPFSQVLGTAFGAAPRGKNIYPKVETIPQQLFKIWKLFPENAEESGFQL